MRYIPGVYQGVPNQREFRAAATGRPLQWDRSDQPAALAAYLNVAFRSLLTSSRVGSAVTGSARGSDGEPPKIVGGVASGGKCEECPVVSGMRTVASSQYSDQ